MTEKVDRKMATYLLTVTKVPRTTLATILVLHTTISTNMLMTYALTNVDYKNN